MSSDRTNPKLTPFKQACSRVPSCHKLDGTRGLNKPSCGLNTVLTNAIDGPEVCLELVLEAA